MPCARHLIFLAASLLSGCEKTPPQNSKPVAQAHFEKSRHLFDEGKRTESLEFLNPAAPAGHQRAKEILAIRCEVGDAMPQDYAQAHTLFVEAAQRGSLLALHKLGLYSHFGHGV